MTKKVTFVIPGNPFGKQRPLVVKTSYRGGRGIKRKETIAYENKARYYWRNAYKGDYDLENPVSLILTAYYQIPDSWPKWKKEAARQGLIRPMKKSSIKPDVDNVTKMIMDSLNQTSINRKHVPNTGLYKDDGQVVDQEIHAFYSDEPRVEVDAYILEKPDLKSLKIQMGESLKAKKLTNKK